MIPIPEVSALGRVMVSQSDSLVLGGDLHLSYLAAGSAPGISAQSCNAYRLSVFGALPQSGFPILASLYLEKRQQNTSLSEWKTTELGFVVSLLTHLFEGSP